MRLLVLASVLCSCALSTPVQGSKLFEADLSSLEERFFFHEYAGDTDDERLDRLDQIVFGRVRAGSAQKRLTSLLMSVPNVEAKTVQPKTTGTNTVAPAAFESEKPILDTSQPVAAPSRAGQSSTQDSTDTSDPSNDYYPTVTALEEQIAHKTAIHLPVQERLARLETIAFGKPSTSNDLSARVDQLKEYVRGKNGGNENYLTNSSAVTWPSADTGLNAEVSSMEQQVFGKTYARDNLTSRLARLERDILPSQTPQTFTPLETRVSDLMSALQTRNNGHFNYSQPTQNSVTNARNAGRSKHHPLLHKLGVALGEVGVMAARSMMYSGYGGYGGYGY